MATYPHDSNRPHTATRGVVVGVDEMPNRGGAIEPRSALRGVRATVCSESGANSPRNPSKGRGPLKTKSSERTVRQVGQTTVKRSTSLDTKIDVAAIVRYVLIFIFAVLVLYSGHGEPTLASMIAGFLLRK